MKKKIIILITAAVLLVSVVTAGIVIYLNQKDKIWDLKANVPEEYREYQSYWLTGSMIIKCEKGYYVIDSRMQGELICFWDGKSDTYSPICTKANCNHDNKECSAWFDNSSCDALNYSNGYFFYRYWENGGDMYLYRADADGTNRKELFQICDFNAGEDIGYYDIHKNHIFVTVHCMDEEIDSYIIDYNMELEGKEGYKTVITETENVPEIRDIVGDKMLYLVYNASENKTQIFEYNISDKSSTCIDTIDEGVGYYRYIKDSYVHTSATGNYLVTPEKGKIKLNDSAGDQLACDSNYIYIDNVPVFKKGHESEAEHKVSIYDTEGKLLKEVAMPDDPDETLLCVFGDDSRMFAYDAYIDYFYVLDKNDKNSVWRKIDIDRN